MTFGDWHDRIETARDDPTILRRRFRALIALLVALLCLAELSAPLMAQVATPEAAPPPDPQPQTRGVTEVDGPSARLLAQRHTPIVMIRKRDEICASDGEAYWPVPVELVFDNSAVRLRHNAGGPPLRDPVLVDSPSIDDIATADADSYLDFPGHPRSPGCTYERWYRATMSEYEPTVYARVLEAAPEHVVVQYHLYYVFNDFNNMHESDWEMIQLRFDVPTVRDALATVPSQVAYAQHAGGETADWDGGKLEREGLRPVVYVSQGSHASHYSPATWLGWGERGSGFGCDTTEQPVRPIDVSVVLLDAQSRNTPSQAWVQWRGRWGERQRWQYNGPVGPKRTKRWTDPVGWQERLRSDSFSVPGASVLGPAPTDVFCDTTRVGSLAMMRFVGQPWYFLGVLVVPLTLVGGLMYIAWSTLVAALRIYLRAVPAFAALGLLVIPIGMASGLVYDLALRHTPFGTLVTLMENSPVSYYLAALPIGSLQQVLSLVIVVPAVLEIYKALERGEPVTPQRMLAGIYRHTAAVARAGARPLVTVLLAQLSVVGLPWAIDRAVRWGFVPQAVVLDSATSRSAPARSAAIVRGRWWRTAATMLVLGIAGIVPGPLLGIVLMVTDSAAIDDINALSSLVYAVLLPYSILGNTVLYRQRQGRALPPLARIPVTPRAILGRLHRGTA